MLTDIFARRYEKVPMWQTFDEPSRRLVVQTFQLLEQICPFYVGGKVSEDGKTFWTQLHALLARELGLKELSPTTWGYWTQPPNQQWYSGTYPMIKVCETWMLQTFNDDLISADLFIKERLSLVELGFRKCGEAVAEANAKLPTDIEQVRRFELSRAGRKGLTLPGSQVHELRAHNSSINAAFQAAVEELNARFRQAGLALNYHNGFIQLAKDMTLTQKVETPFWRLVTDPKWKNVDHDMKEAIDLRDTGGRDPAFHAAKALESTIKIISDEKQLTTGNEKGAANFIDNLRRGGLIEVWEVEALKTFFSKVRNPLSHGPGAAEMPGLGDAQTDWAIETCMTWVKSLIRRT